MLEWARRRTTEILPPPYARELGANLAEYGLLVSLIALVCFAAVQLFGTQLQATYERIAAAIP